MPYHIGIDIGGTFTDAFVTDGKDGWRGKAPTTADRLVDGLVASLGAATAECGRDVETVLAETERFAVGTTAVTNALTQLSGSRTGVIVTRGFGDLLRMARGHRRALDGMSVPLPEIVPRTAVEEVSERIDARGAVVVPLVEADVERAVRRLVEVERIEALAVCLLWAFQNPDHEVCVRRIACQLYPDLFVSCSSEVFPVIREYERLMTTVLNAYTWQSFSAFMDALERELRQRGLRAPIAVMQSNGGTFSHGEARSKPVFLAQSGPVAGVAAARALGRRMGLRDLITGDMGGTSFDVSVVADGEALHRVRAELFGFWTGMVTVDVNSIGAGGGSIAWRDERGMLRVGPRSAGATPGPAAYGRGGTEPTITDALVALGLIDPRYFLGGRMVLDGERAVAVMQGLANALGLGGATVAAAGVYRLALEQMRGAIKGLLVDKGFDPRRFSFMSYGGCAGLFAAPIARELGMPQVIVPRLASVFSAYGAATADVRRDLSRTCFHPMPVGPDILQNAYESLASQVCGTLRADGVPDECMEVRWEADLRFRRQQWEVTVPVSVGAVTSETVRQLETDFLERYQSLYGRGTAHLAAGVDMVNCRVVGFGRLPQLDGGEAAASGTSGRRVGRGAAQPRPKSRRMLAAGVDVTSRAASDRGGADKATAVELRVWDGEDTQPGMRFEGPALLERRDTIIYVPSGMWAEVDAQESCVVHTGG